MAQDTARQAVKFLEDCLKEAGLRDLRVILFGSRALGGATDESDVDVAIVSSSFQGKDLFERARMIRDVHVRAIREFDLPFDILMFTPEEFDSDSLSARFVRAAAGS